MNIRLSLRASFALIVSLAIAVSVIAPRSMESSDIARADALHPQPLDVIALPDGVTLLTDWVLDSANNRGLAFGTTAAGKTAALTMNLQTFAITVVPGTVSDDAIAGGTPVIYGGYVSVPFTRNTAGDRVVSFALSSLVRVSSTTLPSSAGFGSVWMLNTAGTFGYLGTRGTTTALSKFTVPAFTPALAATLPATHSQLTTLTAVGSAQWATFNTTPATISPISGSTLLPTQTIVLPANVAAPTTAVVDGENILYGTDSTPGQVVVFSTKSKTFTSVLDLDSTERGAALLHLDPATGLLYAATMANDGQRVVTIDTATMQVVGRSPVLSGSVRSAFATGQHLILGSTEPGVAALRMTLADAPAAPAAPIVAEGSTTITATWSAVDSAEPISEYTVRAFDGVTEHTCSTTSLSCTVSGLVNGTTYDVTVTAHSAAGDSRSPSVTATPYTVPGAPRAVTVQRGDSHLVIRWNVPDTGGADIVEYRAQARLDDTVVALCTATTTMCTLNNLTNGVPYRIEVIATNRAGDSAAGGVAEFSTPATTPGAPRDVVTERGAASIAVRWSPPIDNGGDPIVGYRAAALLGNDVEMGACEAVAGSCVIRGLTNGVAYRVAVSARNTMGSSSAVATEFMTTPATTPGLPVLDAVTRHDTRVDVRWTAPIETGGLPITEYRVRAMVGGVEVGGCVTSLTQCLITGLVNGVAHRIDVSAINEVGASESAHWGTDITPATVSGPVVDVAAVRGNARILVAWQVPSDDGGERIVEYRVTALLNDTIVVNTCVTSTLSCELTGLTNGVPYSLAVVAINAVGGSLEARVAGTRTPATVPGSPVIIGAVRMDRAIEVSFSAPVESGGEPIQGYTIHATVNDEVMAECTTIATHCRLGGLTNGVDYTVSVSAHNAAGTSEIVAHPRAVRPATLPEAPTEVTATRGDGQITIDWAASAVDGGEPINTYEARALVEGEILSTCTSAGTSCTLTGLENGRPVYVSVIARSVMGASAPRVMDASITPATTPSAPTAVSGARGDGTISATWTAPVSTGGDSITRYEVRALAAGLPESGCQTTGALTCTIRGLTNGASYRLVVVAVNAMGRGAESAMSSGYVPAGVPSAPRSVAVAGATATAISLRWAVPARINGSAVVDYRVQWSTRSTGGFTAIADPVRAATTSRVARPRRGVVLYFRIVAVNGVGASVASAPVAVRAG